MGHGDGKLWFAWEQKLILFLLFGNIQRFVCSVRSQKYFWGKNDGQHCFQTTGNLIRPYLSRLIACFCQPVVFQTSQQRRTGLSSPIRLSLIQLFLRSVELIGLKFKKRKTSLSPLGKRDLRRVKIFTISYPVVPF